MRLDPVRNEAQVLFSQQRGTRNYKFLVRYASRDPKQSHEHLDSFSMLCSRSSTTRWSLTAVHR